MSKKGFGKFVLGAGIGASLGLLFAPKKGKDLRKALSLKCSEMIDYVKTLDKDDVKDYTTRKVEELKKEIKDLDKEKVLKVAKKKGKDILNKCDELVNYAVNKSQPTLEKVANELRDRAIDVLEETIKKLEKTK